MKNSQPTTKEEIEAAIRDIHRRGSSDYKALEKQIKKAVTPLHYNLAQLTTLHHMTALDYQIHYDRWGRGTGKTTGLGGKIVTIAQAMPRSVGIFIAPSYKFLLTRIIPAIVNGLEVHGWHQGIHYFIGEKPPRSWRWPMPHHCPKDFSKCLITNTGCLIHFVSQDVPGDGRGLNTDFELGDESALLDFGMMEENTTPTLRGSRLAKFKDSPYFTKRFHHSSMPLTQIGNWIFELENKNIQGEKAALIIDANCKVNLQNLKATYLEDSQKTCLSDTIFEAEYLNIRPPVSGADGFYPLLSEKVHGYRPHDNLQVNLQNIGKHKDCRADGDLVSGVPLMLGMDFGSAINFITVAQHLRSLNELRAINNFWVTSQEGKMQDDVVKDFHDYYLPHQGTCRDIFFCYDKTGNVETGNTRQTRAEQVRSQLTKLGWKVRLMTVGRTNPDHSFKFGLWEKILQNTSTKTIFPFFPTFKINILRARTLLVSMNNSKAKEGRKNTIHKDKSIEAKMLRRGERQFASDGSDSLDTIIEVLFSDVHRFGGGRGLPEASTR